MAEAPTGTVAEATLRAQINCINGEAAYEATMAYLREVAQPAMGWNAAGQEEWAGFYVIYVSPGAEPRPEWGAQKMVV